MGFDLGLAAMAYKGVRDEQQRLRDEQYQQAQRDYQRANWEADASLRDQRTANARKTLDLQGAQTDSALALQPGVQQLALTQQGSAQSAAEATAARQPMVNATADQQAHTGLVDAGTGAVQAESRRTAAISEHENMAAKMEQAVAQGQASAQAIHDGMFAHLYASHPDGNFDDTVKQFQFAADKMPLTYPELAGHTIGSVKSETDANGDKALVVRNKKNQILLVKPAAQMAAAYGAQAKTQVLGDGQNLYSVQGGRAVPLTSNTKTPTTKTGSGGKSLGGVQGDLIRMVQEDAKKRTGKEISVPDAMAIIKSNPEGAATRFLSNDYRYTTAKTDQERQKAIDDARQAAGLPPRAPAAAPGLDAATQAAIDKALAR